MEYLHAEYQRTEDLAAAIRLLQADGVSRRALELYSRRPVEAVTQLLPRRSRMSLGAVLSAIAVGTGATALMYWIQLDYPLVTGGMPIVSGWATAVVTFEATMAGAVFGTLLMLLKESGLVLSRRRAPVPDLPDEGAVLQVECEAGVPSIRALLKNTGASRIEVVDSAA
ncbi:MAG: DUF3341 domain-containing protein [Bryobacterales bacterium]|nr:DUF3341 domain-containing protein [Bryobacterales bacterium]